MKYSEIVLKVGLNEEKIPVDIKWKASDSDMEELSDSKAFNLSVWDPIHTDTLNISLWTQDMQTHEMHTFFMQSVVQQMDRYVQATANPHARELVMNMIKELSDKTSEWEESNN